MKKTFLLSIFALGILVFACSPLMHDLETGNGKPDPSATDDLIKTVSISGDNKVGEEIVAMPLDKDGNPVTEDVSYRWEYYDDTEEKWISIDGEKEKTFKIKKEYLDKKIRSVVIKDGKEYTSEEETVEKGKLLTKDIKVEIPYIIKGKEITKGDIKVTAKDKEGNDVIITDFDVPSWIPGQVDESVPIEITVHTEEYEDITVPTEIKVKYPPFELDDIPHDFADGFDDYTKGDLKFKDWDDDYEYSYDGGDTWTDEIKEFKPTDEVILVRHKGDKDPVTGEWIVYPSDTKEIIYKPAVLKVIDCQIEQDDIGLSYDAATHVFTADEGFDEYIWLVKTGWYPDQDTDFIQRGKSNTFKLEDYLNNKPLEYYASHPEFGKPGKYYIQCIGICKDDDAIAPYSATAWMKLE